MFSALCDILALCQGQPKNLLLLYTSFPTTYILSSIMSYILYSHSEHPSDYSFLCRMAQMYLRHKGESFNWNWYRYSLAKGFDSPAGEEQHLTLSLRHRRVRLLVNLIEEMRKVQRQPACRERSRRNIVPWGVCDM